MTKTEAEIQREREEKAIRLDNWSRLKIYLWSDDSRVDQVVEVVYGLMEGIEGFSVKANIQRKHLKVILLNLYANYLEDPNKYTGFYRMVTKYSPAGRYNPLHITKTTIRVVDHLIVLNLIEYHPGHHRREGKGKSHMSRMRAKPALIEVLDKHGWNELTVARAANTECIVLRTRDPTGDRVVELEYEDTDDTRRMREELCRYNNILRTTFVDIPEYPVEGVLSSSGSRIIRINPTNKFVRRIFNNGVWEDGGRFYGPWWQSVPKEWRKRIRIDDEQTIEWDYSGLHIIILYALNRLDYWKEDGDDTYRLPNREPSERLRSLLKLVLLVTINTPDINAALRGIRWEMVQNPTEYEWVKEEGIVLKEVIEEFVQRHRPIEEYFFSEMGVNLQFFDSRIAEIIINELTFRGIPCLTIHDSFITTRQEEQYLESVMNRAIEQGIQETMETEVSNRMKRNLSEETATPWEILRLMNRPFANREKLDDYWEEQTEWVRGLENGQYPEYVDRLNRHRAVLWDSNYYQY